MTNNPSVDQNVALDLDAIEERVNAATRGPWKVKPYKFSRLGPAQRIVMTPHGCMWNDWDGLNSEADGEFIVHAREDVPALVAEVRRLRALVGEQS